MKPKRGALAYCSLGHLGVILSKAPELVNYPDGNTGEAWTGKHLWPFDLFGKPWSSREPTVIGYIRDDRDGEIQYMPADDEGEVP